MYTPKMEDDLDCGIRVAFKVFGGKWKLCILDAISQGVVRPADIHREIGIASMRVIEMQLAELLFDGIVERSADSGFPRKTAYSLTELGQTILPVLGQIDRWGTLNAAEIRARHGRAPLGHTASR